LLTACENYEKQFLIFCKKDTWQAMSY
jgi:hypothetical protein